MKKLELCIVFLLIALMAIGASADTLTEGGNFEWDYGAVGDWDDGDGQNWRDSNAFTGTVIEEPSAESVALATGKWPINIAGPTAVCTVDTVVGGWSGITTQGTRIRILEGATMNVVDGADITGVGWIRVGDMRGTPNSAYLNQTGGRIFLTHQRDLGSFAVGDANRSPDGGMLPGSTYTISGGTLAYDAADSNCTGQLILGLRNGHGQMTIVGTAPVINMKNLYIAADSNLMSGGPYNYDTGILEYQIASNGVSPIVLDGTVYIDQGTDTTANLILQLTAAPPPEQDILLVDTATPIYGTFDTVTGDLNGGRAEEGDRIKLLFGGNDYYYDLTYAGGITGTDLELIWVPEPATICLLGLGALSLIRRKNNK